VADLSIVLSKYNLEGLCTSIEDQDEDCITILIDRYTDDVEFVCRYSAKKLRLLADAFDILATMDKPCTPRAQKAALAAAKQAARTSEGGLSRG
jgi:hypothetical protein